MIRQDNNYNNLSPAYDQLPDISHQRVHVLYFQHNHIDPGITNLVELEKTAGV